jgi:hypothetical protein
MKNMFNNTDLLVFQVMHKLIEHPKVNFAQIDPRVIKAYTWLMHATNTQEQITHDLTDKAFSAAVGLSEDYISNTLRPAFAELTLVGYVKNQRGRGYRYFVLDPDSGLVIDPSPFNAAKLTVDQIRRYYRVSLERLGVAVNTEDILRKGQRLLVAHCPLCRRTNHRPHFEVKLEDEGHWMCHDCNRYGDMLMFEQQVHEQIRGKKLFKNQAAVMLVRFLKSLHKSAGVAVPVTDDEIQDALGAAAA